MAIIEAVHLFLGFLPFPDALLSDFGPEMGLQLTKALAKLGIKHVGRIPLRSNQQGAAESSIRFLKCMLHKLFALPTYGGRDDWVRLLLITVKNLNATHCYGAKLSINALYLSLFHDKKNGLVLDDSFLLQQNTFEFEYQNKKISKCVFPFKKGNFCTIKLIQPTELGSIQNILPKHKDIWKITEIFKSGFGLI